MKILTASGDTVRGEGILKYDSVRFRNDAGAKASYYGPDEAQLIYIDGEVFASSEFIGLSPSEKAVLDDQFFIKVLLTGDMDLYYHQNKSNRKSPVIFFIKKGEEPAFQLIKSISSEHINGVEYRRVNDAYREQLSNLFKDCPSMTIDSRRDYYKEKVMLELVRTYGSCKNYRTLYMAKVVAKKPSFTAMAGIDIGSISTNANSASLPSTYGYFPNDGSIKPFFGFQMAIATDRKGKLSSITELMFNQVSATTSYHGSVTVFLEEQAVSTINRSYIRLNEGIRRNLRLGDHLNANILAGVSFSFVLNSSYIVNRTFTNTATGTVTHDTFDLAENFQNSEGGFFGGGGITYKKTGLLLRYEKTLSISGNHNLNATVQNIYIGVTYRLSK